VSRKSQQIALLYNDDYFLIADKPSGIAVIPERFKSDKLDFKQLLEKQIGISLFTVHRIDRDTSGLVVFAKTAEAHKELNTLFEHHKIDKTYLALVHGVLEGDTGEIDSPIATHPSKSKMIVHPKGKEAYTSFKVIQQFRHAAFLEVKIKTGRTHQIRVHFASAGHPLLIDPLYGTGDLFFLSSIKKGYKKTEEEERPILSRLSLHASSLSFEHPFTKQLISVTSSLPKDLSLAIQLLEKYDT